MAAETGDGAGAGSAVSGDRDQEPAEDQGPEDGATLFVKNINFDTTDDALKEVSGRAASTADPGLIYWVPSDQRYH